MVPKAISAFNLISVDKFWNNLKYQKNLNGGIQWGKNTSLESILV
jgi:hypothetical protein